LPDGPGGFPRDFSCPAVLRNLPIEPDGFRLQDCHLLWSDFPDGSTSDLVYHSTALRPSRPYNPREQAPWFGLLRVRSPLLAESLTCFLFLEVLRWFTSLRCLLTPMNSARDPPGLTRVGFPIRKSPGQSLLAAHRGLSQLATSFIDCWCQGIHRTPLVA
jgi:hypothetical protein